MAEKGNGIYRSHEYSNLPRTDEDLAGTDNGVSKQLASWQKFIAFVGVPSVIALGLSYQLAVTFKDVPRDVAAARAQMTTNERMIQDTAERIDRLERYMLQICLNTATNEAARGGCWSAVTRGQ